MIKDTMDTLCHFQPSNGSEVLMQAIYTFTSELEDVRLHLSSAYVNTVCDSIPYHNVTESASGCCECRGVSRYAQPHKTREHTRC